jgi:hypothetical protein
MQVLETTLVTEYRADVCAEAIAKQPASQGLT